MALLIYKTVFSICSKMTSQMFCVQKSLIIILNRETSDREDNAFISYLLHNKVTPNIYKALGTC